MSSMSGMDSLAFVLVGFAVVLIALVMLWGVSSLIGRNFRRFGSTPSRPGKPVEKGLIPHAPPETTIPPDHIAAIAAAVAELTDGRGRIVSVLAPAQVFTQWAQEGRTEQFSSHRVRWDWAVPGPPPANNNDSPRHN